MSVPLRLIGRRLLGFTLLWWVLTEGYPGAWGLGVPIILLALLSSMALPRTGDWHWRPGGILRFIPFFMLQSLSGGIDVARRALHPRLPLAPQMIEYRLRLQNVPARIFYADTLSLLPGTCSASLQEEVLRIHVLDASLPIESALKEVEGRVATLFGVSLTADVPEGGRR